MRYAGANLPLKTAHKQSQQAPPRFLADAMLGSVARKLRAFGFDTAYLAHTHDDEVMRVGEAEARTILTADRELFKRIVASNRPGVLVDCKNEFEDLLHILAKAGAKSIALDGDPGNSAGSRCSTCNGLLENRNPSQVEGLVPVPLLARHDKFYQCSSCGKVYWHGGHFKRLSVLAGRLDARLAALGAGNGAKNIPSGPKQNNGRKRVQTTKG